MEHFFPQQIHLRQNSIDPQETHYNFVQLIWFEVKTAVAIPKLIQEIYVP